jgi:hypothetical protein
MKRICVFCGSSQGSRPEYRAAGEDPECDTMSREVEGREDKGMTMTRFLALTALIFAVLLIAAFSVSSPPSDGITSFVCVFL